MHTCYSCQAATVTVILDLGQQPISNRFIQSKTTQEFTHPLILGLCQTCGLVQLVNPAPSSEVKSHFDWIRYNEPEGHLDEVAELLSQLPGITADTQFCGISGKEGSLLDRLNRKGYTHTWELSCKEDLGVSDPRAGIETIQSQLDCNKSRMIAQKRSAPNVIIARHILEHAHHPQNFMHSLRELVQADGYIVFEVPDCTKLFETYEYSAIWEEHTLYFTPYTFKHCLAQMGFNLHSFNIYPYSMENCMLAIVKVNANNGDYHQLNNDFALVENEKKRALNFAKEFHARREWIKKTLTSYREAGPMTLLGAGHLACHFINLMGIKHLFDFVVDDHPNKKGLYMPGSQLPIFSSAMLEEKQIKTCLLSLNQESEQKVIAKKQDFIAKGGQFYSIFSTSPHAMVEVNT